MNNQESNTVLENLQEIGKTKANIKIVVATLICLCLIAFGIYSVIVYKETPIQSGQTITNVVEAQLSEKKLMIPKSVGWLLIILGSIYLFYAWIQFYQVKKYKELALAEGISNFLNFIK